MRRLHWTLGRPQFATARARPSRGSDRGLGHLLTRPSLARFGMSHLRIRASYLIQGGEYEQSIEDSLGDLMLRSGWTVQTLRPSASISGQEPGCRSAGCWPPGSGGCRGGHQSGGRRGCRCRRSPARAARPVPESGKGYIYPSEQRQQFRLVGDRTAAALRALRRRRCRIPRGVPVNPFFHRSTSGSPTPPLSEPTTEGIPAHGSDWAGVLSHYRGIALHGSSFNLQGRVHDFDDLMRNPRAPARHPAAHSPQDFSVTREPTSQASRGRLAPKPLDWVERGATAEQLGY